MLSGREYSLVCARVYMRIRRARSVNGGESHRELNVCSRPITSKYHEGKMPRSTGSEFSTFRRELSMVLKKIANKCKDGKMQRPTDQFKEFRV